MAEKFIGISSRAYQALRIEAALQDKEDINFLSELILENISDRTRNAIGIEINQKLAEMPTQPTEKSANKDVNRTARAPKGSRRRKFNSKIESKIIKRWNAGETNRAKLSREFNIPPSTMGDWIRKMIKAGDIKEEPIEYKPSLSKDESSEAAKESVSILR